jgi:hypothetical protein
LKTLFIALCLIYSTSTFAQDIERNKHVYEQIALDFFIDSLLHKKEPFLKTRAYFDGKVDSSITVLGFSCIKNQYYREKQKDKELEQYLNYEARADNAFHLNNKKAPFLLQVKKPVKKRFIKLLAPKRSTAVIQVFQNKSIGDKNYIWFRLYTRSGWSGKDLYFTVNDEGEVLDWCYLSFIF